MQIKDKVFEIYGDNVAAEQIAHTKHVTELTPKGLSSACMLDIDPDFHKKMQIGRIMVAGKNFGCNSSREWAPAALKYSDVQIIIAESFARIFFRNAINIGLPILECENMAEFCKPGDELDIDLTTGEIKNLTSKATKKGTILPEFLLKIMSGGGLLETLKAEMKEGVQ